MVGKILRVLPAFKGKHRFSKFILSLHLSNKREFTFIGMFGCKYSIPNIKEIIGFDLFINGVYELETIKLILNNLPKDGVLIDIGANIGAISIPVAKKRKDASLISIEASPRVFNYLENNVRLNQINTCKLINKAVSMTDGEVVNFYSPEELYGKGSLASVYTNDAETVETITLDEVVKIHKVKKVDFIKIDIEGHEYGAFKGGHELLTRSNAPDILFEFQDWAEKLADGCKPGDAQQLLINYGYTLYKIEKDGRLKKMDKALTTGETMILATKKTLNKKE